MGVIPGCQFLQAKQRAVTKVKLEVASYTAQSDWKLLPAFDFPHNPTRCLVTGTGLTHKNSALDRVSMHEGQSAGTEMSDSMKMYNLGVEGGRYDNFDTLDCLLNQRLARPRKRCACLGKESLP